MATIQTQRVTYFESLNTGSNPVLTTCVVPLRKECQESRFCNLPLQHRGLLILNTVRWRNEGTKSNSMCWIW